MALRIIHMNTLGVHMNQHTANTGAFQPYHALNLHRYLVAHHYGNRRIYSYAQIHVGVASVLAYDNRVNIAHSTDADRRDSHGIDGFGVGLRVHEFIR